MRNRRAPLPMVAAAALFLSTTVCPVLAQRSGVELSTFVADITPPLGEGVGIGFIREQVTIEHPLYARGVVLRDEGGVYVLCALDLCGLVGDTYDLFREKIAEAAGTKPGRVAVQSLHQHTAPVYDANARRHLYRDEPEKLAHGLSFARKSADNVATAVGEAMKSFQRVTHIGTSKAKVERVASNRRVPQPDGSLLSRLSSTKDKKLQAAPEGTIDPWLRTVSFFDGDKALAQLHYYATHPQTFYGKGRIGYDAPGIALERLQRETGVAQIYFTGCGGNVAMGKYNDGMPATRTLLARRLYDAMARSGGATSMDKQPAVRIRWSTRAVKFALRDEPAFSAETQKKILANPKAAFSTKIKAAELLGWIERVEAERPIEFSCLAIGKVRLVHLPGEPFVQFQLAAQKAAPDAFVAVAGYGDCGPWYIGEDCIYTDRGGYEQTWAFTAPCERLMKATIRDLLKAGN
jgi:hypothetical protein